MNAVALDVPGADLEGVQYGVDFMKKANLGEPIEVGKDVVVIGGGYTAMDCSRTSLRHGAENVAIVYRRTRSELVVDEEELGETEREGVRMEFLASPVEVLGEDGHVTGVKFIRNKLGEPDASGRRSPVPIPGSEFVIKADTVIPAVSQAADLTFLPVEADFEVNRGRVKVDPATYATNVRGVFACGDFVTGPTTLIEAAGHGKKAAYAIDRYLAGAHGRDRRREREDDQLVDVRDARVLRRPAAPAHPDDAARRSGCRRPTRTSTSRPRSSGATTRPAAVAESTRCLMCNYNIWFDPFRCVLCGACADVCPEGVIHMVDINQLKSRGPPDRARRGLRLAGRRRDDPRRGALHPLRAVRQALPVRRHYDGAVRAAGDLDRRPALQGVVPRRAARRDARRRRRNGPLSFLERVDQAIRRSPAWRSLFRNPYPTDERSRAYAVMNNVFLHLHPVRVRQHAVKFAYTFCLGGLSFFLFLVLTVTGVYLMFFYVPSTTSAYTDILDIQARVAFGAADPERPSVGRPPDGVLRLPAHDAGLLPRGLQAAARVQLGRRRAAAAHDDRA